MKDKFSIVVDRVIYDLAWVGNGEFSTADGMENWEKFFTDWRWVENSPSTGRKQEGSVKKKVVYQKERRRVGGQKGRGVGKNDRVGGQKRRVVGQKKRVVGQSKGNPFFFACFVAWPPTGTTQPKGPLSI